MKPQYGAEWDNYKIKAYELQEEAHRLYKANEEALGKYIDNWHRKYIDRMKTIAGLTEKEAKDALDAGMGEYDYNDNAIDAADSEMSYWDA